MDERIQNLVDEELELMKGEQAESGKAVSVTGVEKGELPVVPKTLETQTSDVEQSAIQSLNDEKYLRKSTSKWGKVKKRRVENRIESEDVVADLEKAQNKADRQAISNRLYVLKQEKKRSVKEQKHLNNVQREKQRQEIAEFRWEEYEDTLRKYGYNKTPSSGVFRTIIAIDGVVCFLEGLNKASNKLVKVLKWVIIAGLAVAGYFIIKAL